MVERNFQILSFMIMFWNGLWTFKKSTTSFLKKKQKKKVTNAILKQNTHKNNKKKLFQKCTNSIEMLNLITRPIFPTIRIHNSCQKKGKMCASRSIALSISSGATISAINFCPTALPITILRILSTCIACLMYKFKLNTAKRLSHLWHFVIDDQSWKYWIRLSRIEWIHINSQTDSILKSCKSSTWLLAQEHLPSPWIASLVSLLYCCIADEWK